MPDDLDEDWQLAQLTEAPQEPCLTVLDEWRQEAVIQSAFVVPTEWPALPKDCVEPGPTATNEWLYAAIELRPGELDYEQLDVQHTQYVMNMLGYASTDRPSVQLAHWARLVGFDLMRTKFRHANTALNTFYDSVATPNQWKETTNRMLERCEQDLSWKGLVPELAALIAESEEGQTMVREIIALTIAQIEHWKAIDSVRRTRQFAKRALREVDPLLVERSPTLRAYRYEGTELWQAPMGQLIDTTGDIIASEVAEPAQPERGVAVHSMILLWNVLPLFYEHDGRDAKHTRNMLNRIGKPGDARVLEATWVRRVVMQYMKVHIEQAPEIHYMYSREHKMSAARWMEHSKELRRELKWNDPELERLVRDCMELIDLPEECYEFCMRIAALQQAEVAYWNDKVAFAQAVDKATEESGWVDEIQVRLEGADESVRFVEPQLRYPHTAPDAPFKLAPNRFAAGDLASLPLEEIIDNATGKQRPALVEEPYTSDDMARLSRARQWQKEAAMYLAEPQHQDYHRHARKLADRLCGERVSSESMITLVHEARHMAFSIAGSSYQKYNWLSHLHSKWVKQPGDKLVETASNAVDAVYKDHPEWGSEIDECARALSVDAYEQNLARHVMCLTITQLLAYKAAYEKEGSSVLRKKRRRRP